MRNLLSNVVLKVWGEGRVRVREGGTGGKQGEGEKGGAGEPGDGGQIATAEETQQIARQWPRVLVV